MRRAGSDQYCTQESSGVKGKSQTGDQLGGRLEAGDFDEDGYDDLAIGVCQENIDGVYAAGAVNVIYGSATRLDASHDDFWHENEKGIPSKATKFELFGVGLVATDCDGEGKADLKIAVFDAPGVAAHMLYGASGGLSAARRSVLPVALRKVGIR